MLNAPTLECSEQASTSQIQWRKAAKQFRITSRSAHGISIVCCNLAFSFSCRLMCFATYIVRTSLKYSRTSPSSGTRLMLVNQVALGKCCDFSTHQKHLKRAPAGYDSCHGVKAMANNRSDFAVCFYSFFLCVFHSFPLRPTGLRDETNGLRRLKG